MAVLGTAGIKSCNKSWQKSGVAYHTFSTSKGFSTLYFDLKGWGKWKHFSTCTKSVQHNVENVQKRAAVLNVPLSAALKTALYALILWRELYFDYGFWHLSGQRSCGKVKVVSFSAFFLLLKLSETPFFLLLLLLPPTNIVQNKTFAVSDLHLDLILTSSICLHLQKVTFYFASLTSFSAKLNSPQTNNLVVAI